MINIHHSWEAFFDQQHLEMYQSILKEIGSDFTPKEEFILRFAKLDLYNLKVCIIGQDPYYSMDKGELVANGRAFQPSNLINWNQTFRQVSLKNIIRLIHKTYCDIKEYEQIYKYKDIVADIDYGYFALKQPLEWFDSLEKQGVLFLNRSLSTKINEADVHTHLWYTFANDLITYIDQNNPHLYYFLWGKKALELKSYIMNGKIISANHPMMCSNKQDMDFLKSDCFLKTKNIINWLG